MLKKYRALLVIGGSMIFNLLTSMLFAKNGMPFNLKPLSVGEWVCDMVSMLIFFFGLMLMTYDIWEYKPKKMTTYTRVNGKIVEVKVEE